MPTLLLKEFKSELMPFVAKNVIAIKNLPISKGNNGIEQYLISNGIKLYTQYQYTKARDENNQLSD